MFPFDPPEIIRRSNVSDDSRVIEREHWEEKRLITMQAHMLKFCKKQIAAVAFIKLFEVLESGANNIMPVAIRHVNLGTN